MTLSLVISLSSHKGPRGGIVIPSLLGMLVSALDTNTVPSSWSSVTGCNLPPQQLAPRQFPLSETGNTNGIHRTQKKC